MNHDINIFRLKAVNKALANFSEEFVFVGGAVLSLYADRIAEEIRETEDVDVAVKIYTIISFVQMEEQLRSIGFQPDPTSKFVGRYIIRNLVVDFMPLDEKVLGFKNKWYEEGMKYAVTVALDKTNFIKIFSAPYFVAAKLEAFKNRGRNLQGEIDGRTSTDFEDFIFVIVNRESIWLEMSQAEENLKMYLQVEFSELLNNPYFEEWIDAHTGYVSPAAQVIILPRAKKFIET